MVWPRIRYFNAVFKKQQELGYTLFTMACGSWFLEKDQTSPTVLEMSNTSLY
jgi:hypothetical protein